MVLSYFSENRLNLSREKYYFIPSLKYLTQAGASHKTFLGYLFFIRGILDLREPFPASFDRMDFLLANFRTAVNLEPRLLKAYFFGGIAAAVSRPDILKAIDFLEEGRINNPGKWELPFWIGLNYLQLGDYTRANEYYLKAAQLPGSPDYLKTNRVFFYYKAGEVDQGIAYLRSLMRSLDDKRLIELIKFKLAWLEQLAWLEEKVRQYQGLYGLYPESLQDLVNKGLIAEIPADLFGKGFYLEKKPESLKPRVKSRALW